MKGFSDSILEYNNAITEYNNAIAEYNISMDALNLAFAEYAMSIEEYQIAVDELTDSLNNIAVLSVDFYEAFAALKSMADNGNEMAKIAMTLLEIQISMDNILSEVQTVATSEQVQSLTQQVSQMSDDIQLSIQGSDVDGDGIIHSEDECPTLAGPESNNGCPV